jgi:hypothetical protein
MVGVDVTATLQKGGRPVNGVVEPGGVKLPLMICWAVVTLASGSDSPARLWQLGAAARSPATRSAATETVENTNDFNATLMAKSSAKRSPLRQWFTTWTYIYNLLAQRLNDFTY